MLKARKEPRLGGLAKSVLLARADRRVQGTLFFPSMAPVLVWQKHPGENEGHKAGAARHRKKDAGNNVGSVWQEDMNCPPAARQPQAPGVWTWVVTPRLRQCQGTGVGAGGGPGPEVEKHRGNKGRAGLRETGCRLRKGARGKG